jgi:hypothetical protein
VWTDARANNRVKIDAQVRARPRPDGGHVAGRDSEQGPVLVSGAVHGSKR